MTNLTDVVYAKIETQQFEPIWLCVVYDGNYARQWHDQSYRCGLCQLSYRDRLDRVSSVKKTKQDNDMTDYTSVVYIENDTEMSWPIGSGADCDENQI